MFFPFSVHYKANQVLRNTALSMLLDPALLCLLLPSSSSFPLLSLLFSYLSSLEGGRARTPIPPFPLVPVAGACLLVIVLVLDPRRSRSGRAGEKKPPCCPCCCLPRGGGSVKGLGVLPVTRRTAGVSVHHSSSSLSNSEAGIGDGDGDGDEKNRIAAAAIPPMSAP